MNERIKELNAQADKYAWEKVGKKYDGTGDLNWQWEDTKMEKFAELIVRECAQIAVFKDSGTVATADVAGHMAAGRSIAARLIKKHFGVDE